jgi:hypothetical protein
VNLKIGNNSSGGIVIGMGILDVAKNNDYKMLEDEHHGILGISSSGFTVIHDNPEQ